jgi:large subunit ribosomal protein L13
MYVQPMKTFSLKKEEIKKKWLLIDAEKAVLGRLAVISANILRGKNKPQYTPNQDCGDNLIIINADKIYLTGKKESNKIYYRHTGHPGGIKETTPEKMKEKNKSTEIIKLAIRRMIPKGPLGYQQLSNCKIFSGSTHLHDAQVPEKLDISKLNNKNIAR